MEGGVSSCLSFADTHSSTKEELSQQKIHKRILSSLGSPAQQADSLPSEPPGKPKREYYEQSYVNKLDNPEEMNKFLETQSP